MKLASCKSALNPPVVYSTDRSKAVVPVLVLLVVALWFILQGDLLYVIPCVILFLCFSVLLVLRLPRLGKRELILVLFVGLFGLYFNLLCKSRLIYQLYYIFLLRFTTFDTHHTGKKDSQMMNFSFFLENIIQHFSHIVFN